MSCCELSVDSISHDPFALIPDSLRYPAAIITSSNTNITDLMLDNRSLKIKGLADCLEIEFTGFKPTYANELDRYLR